MSHYGLLLADFVCVLRSCSKGVLFTGNLQNLDMQYVKVIMLMTKTWLQSGVEEETFTLSDFFSSVTGSMAEKQTLHRHWNYACRPTGNISVTISFCNSHSGSNVKIAGRGIFKQIDANWIKRTTKKRLLLTQFWVARSSQHLKPLTSPGMKHI